MIRDLCKGQSVVATSSGEAELYAAVSTMKDMILIRRALCFIGLDPPMELRMDSSAARAMLERQGAGRVRHVEVAVLWAQQWIKERAVALRAEPSKSNPADLGTKVHTADRFKELLTLIGLRSKAEMEAEASCEALPVATVSAVNGQSPLKGLVVFLSTLLTQVEGTELQMWRGNDQVEIAGYNFEINWAKVVLIALAAVFLIGTVFGIALSLAVARLSAPKPSRVAPVRRATATR